MHKAQPLTIGSNLLTEIEQFGLTDELPSPFELMRLKRDADKLLKISAVESYVVKAGIAALEWDAAAVLDNASKALWLGSDVTTYLNCAHSLRFVGNFAGAADLMVEAAQRYPMSSDVLKFAVDLLVSAGRLRVAAKMCQDFVDRSLPLADFAESTILLAAKAEELGVTDEMMVAQAGFAFDVLTQHRRRMREYILVVSSDPDGSDVMVCRVQFIGSAIDEMRLESELACKLADLPDWNPCLFAMELLAVPLQHADLSA